MSTNNKNIVGKRCLTIIFLLLVDTVYLNFKTDFKCLYIQWFGRSFGLMVSALDSGLSGSSLSKTGTLCCVLGQGTLLSQSFSSPRCLNGYWWIYCWGNSAMPDEHSIHGEVEIHLVASCFSCIFNYYYYINNYYYMLRKPG